MAPDEKLVTFKLDLTINWIHIFGIISVLIGLGAGFAKLDNKMNILLAYVTKVEAMEVRMSYLEGQDKAQAIFNRNYDERFSRDEDNIKNQFEQRPHHN